MFRGSITRLLILQSRGTCSLPAAASSQGVERREHAGDTAADVITGAARACPASLGTPAGNAGWGAGQRLHLGFSTTHSTTHSTTASTTAQHHRTAPPHSTTAQHHRTAPPHSTTAERHRTAPPHSTTAPSDTRACPVDLRLLRYAPRGALLHDDGRAHRFVIRAVVAPSYNLTFVTGSASRSSR